MPMKKRYHDLNTYFKRMYGCRVHKLTVDAGLSCPNRDGTLSTRGCIYCNARGSGTGAMAKGVSLTEQINRGKTHIAKRFKAKKVLVYFQSFSNTYAPPDRLKRLYEEALAVEDVVGLCIGTRPDCVDEPILEMIGGYGENRLIWLEYGLQSAHDRTLALINRGHDVAAFQRAVRMTRRWKINICAHVILGLPGETEAHMMETARMVSEMELDGVKLHLLYVVKGTRLEAQYRRGRYQCLEQRAYVDLVCDFLERLPGETVIHRLTGDPHPHELAAPDWSMEKKATLDMIKETLEKRDSWQGKQLGVPFRQDRKTCR